MSLYFVKNVHLLIHPLYVGDQTRFMKPDPKRQMNAQMYSSQLSDRYLKRAASLKENEALITFSHLKSGEALDRRDDYLGSYETFLSNLRFILENRFVVMPGEFDIFQDQKVATHAVKKLRNQGLSLTQESKAIAFGENLKACVAQGTHNLQKAFGLTQPTLVEVAYTEAYFWWPFADEPEKNLIRAYYRSLGLLLNEVVADD